MNAAGPASRAPARGSDAWDSPVRWVIVMCRAACVLLASLASACSPSDEGVATANPDFANAADSANPAGPWRAPPDVRSCAGSERRSRVRGDRRGRVPARRRSQQSAVSLSDVRFLLACDENKQSGRVFSGVRTTTLAGTHMRRSTGVILRIRLRLLLSRRLRSRRPVGTDRLLPRGSGPAAPSHAQHSCWRVNRRLRRCHELAVHRPRGSVAHGQPMRNCRHRVGGGHAECRGAPGGWRPRSIDLLVYNGQLCRPHHAARARSRRHTGARRDVSRPGGDSRRRTVTAIQRHDDVAVANRQSANESDCAPAGTRSGRMDACLPDG